MNGSRPVFSRIGLGLGLAVGMAACTLDVLGPVAPPPDAWDPSRNTHPDSSVGSNPCWTGTCGRGCRGWFSSFARPEEIGTAQPDTRGSRARTACNRPTDSTPPA